MAAPPLPPKMTVTIQNVADTLPPPSTAGIFGWPGLPPGLATWYRYLGLPVIAQNTWNDRLFAFPARVNLVFGITAANDEAVFSNGPGYSLTGSPAATLPYLVEGSPLGGNSLGNLTPLQLAAGSVLTNPSVERLQISSNGILACQTFSNAGGLVFREGIATSDSGMLSLGAAHSSLPMTARQPGVMDDQCMNIAAREQWLAAPAQRINRFQFPGGTGAPMNPLSSFLTTNWFVASNTPTGLGGLWMAAQGAVGRLGSPSISESGVVAAHCIDNVATPFKRPHIRIEDPSFGQAIVMRQGNACGPNGMGANFFGVVHSSLMALNIRSAFGGTKDAIAWQMTNMRTAPNSGIIAQPSLWCRQMSFPPTGTYITHGGASAPGIPGYIFDTFYALHVTEDPTNPSISRIIFGANLLPASMPQKRAIYSCDISGGAIVAGSLVPIATNVPGITPLMPWSGGTDEIAAFGTNVGTSGHRFSVSRNGDVLFKATLGANITAPAPTAAQRQVLVVASAATGYALQVWAQSGLTTFTSMGGSPTTFSNFTLTQPDQGTYSRGQAIATLPDSSGTLSPNIIFRGHAGAAHAIILAN